MNTQQGGFFRQPTLKDLLTIFINRLWLIVSAMLVTVGVMALVVYITFEPQYSSTATLYILQQYDDVSTVTASDFNLSMDVLEDCVYILKSRSVLNQVIEMLDLDTTADILAGGIETENPQNTRFLKVTAVGTTPTEARKTVNSICALSVEEINKTLQLNQATIYEKGMSDATPSNKVMITDYLLAAAVAAVAVYGFFVFLFMLDDGIRSDEDIADLLDLPVLGSIPNANDGSDRYGARSKYAYYSPRRKERGLFWHLRKGKKNG